MSGNITDIHGLKVGHYTDLDAATGCTVVLCQSGAIAGVDVRGSAPGTRETDLLRPMNLIQQVHAILLSGGSAFGLDAASGVMRYLAEQGCGFNTGFGIVPIVPAAVLFDLNIGSSLIRPGADAGYQACLNGHDGSIAEGSVGAGTGATVGKFLGIHKSVKSGIGSASLTTQDGVIVAALIAVNAVGDILDHKTGRIIAGPRDERKGGFLSSIEIMKEGIPHNKPLPENTTIGVVATNAVLTKEQANKLAQMAHDGLSRSINPCHTMHDGDTIFSISAGDFNCDLSMLGALAAETVSCAIERAVLKATTVAGIPSINELSFNIER